MRKLLVVAVLACTLISTGFAQERDLPSGRFEAVDSDDVIVWRASGLRDTADRRDPISVGDTVITATTGVEIRLPGPGTAVLEPDSVLAFRGRGVDDEAVAYAQLGYGSMRLSASDDSVHFGTPAVYGVLLSGSAVVQSSTDGATRIVVVDGEAMVAPTVGEFLDDRTTRVAADRAMVALPGAPTRNVFAAGADTDFALWDAERIQIATDDPARALQRLSDELAGYINEIRDRLPRVEELGAEVDALMPRYALILSRDGAEDANKYFRDEIAPFQKELNLELDAIATSAYRAMMLRRHAFTPLYQLVAGIGFAAPEVWAEFSERANRFLSAYEEHVTPHLANGAVL